MSVEGAIEQPYENAPIPDPFSQLREGELRDALNALNGLDLQMHELARENDGISESEKKVYIQQLRAILAQYEHVPAHSANIDAQLAQLFTKSFDRLSAPSFSQERLERMYRYCIDRLLNLRLQPPDLTQDTEREIIQFREEQLRGYSIPHTLSQIIVTFMPELRSALTAEQRQQLATSDTWNTQAVRTADTRTNRYYFAKLQIETSSNWAELLIGKLNRLRDEARQVIDNEIPTLNEVYEQFKIKVETLPRPLERIREEDETRLKIGLIIKGFIQRNNERKATVERIVEAEENRKDTLVNRLYCLAAAWQQIKDIALDMVDEGEIVTHHLEGLNNYRDGIMEDIYDELQEVKKVRGIV